MKVKPVIYPEEYLYHPGHEWVLAQEDVCTVGITHFAQSELEEIVYVELPKVGQSFEAGGAIGIVESIKAAVELYTPVAGEVIEVNPDLLERPPLLNDAPHGRGWMIKVLLASPKELEGLMDSERYQRFLRGED